MKIHRLGSALTLSLLSLSVAHAAKYSVVEIPVTELGQYSYATAINDSGQVAVTVQNSFNPPIDVSLVDFENAVLVETLTDLEGAKAGNINDEDLAILYSYVKSGANNALFQQLAIYQSYLLDNNSAQLLPGLDQIDSGLGSYSQSVNTITHGLNNTNVRVGTSSDPFYKVPYTFEDGSDKTFVVHDFTIRGFADINGSIIELPPVDTTLGGESEGLDINNSLTAVGYGTVLVSASLQASVDNCNDDTKRGDQPLETCLQGLMGTGSIGGFFQRRAMVWQLDEQGNIVETKQLGLLITPAEDDTRVYVSRALAINDNGIIVGESQTYFQEKTTSIVSQAAIFDGDLVTTFVDDQEFFGSSAADINNNNLVVGQAFKTINGGTRSKFFIHDINSGETAFPLDFFPGSSSVAKAINNNNLVVGQGEVESSITGTRAREAFLYDHNTEEFINLNSLLSCDSPYVLSQANDINNNDEISATAVKRLAKRDVAGNEQLDSAGNVIFEDTVVAVKLIPIAGGSVDDCSANDDVFTRNGASLQNNFLLALLLLTGFRMWRRKS
jgi:hypothetical protein